MKKFIKIILIILILGIILYFGLYLYAFISPKLNVNNSKSYYFYDINQNLITGTDDWISYEELDQDIINATIAIEDKNFFNHIGFDYLRIVKSLYIEIADYYETTWNCVEKNIRWLVKQIWTKDNDSILNEIFNKTSADFRITNKEFFRDMYEYIQNTYEENEVISSRLVCPITRQYCKAFTDYCMMGNVDQDGGE